MKTKKKILLISSGDVNGAYEYVYRLAKILLDEGNEVAMIVKNKAKTDDFIYSYNDRKSKYFKFLFLIAKKFKNKIFKKSSIENITLDPKYYFLSKDETKLNISAKSLINQIGFCPDLIFTGMTIDFMNSTDLLSIQQFTKAQVYNLTVDMNHFTGGCHFAWDCTGYINGCEKCPAILSEFGKNTAKINFETKFNNAKIGNFKIIAGSGWTLQQSKSSKIYGEQQKIININSLVDTNILNAKNREFAKRVFGLDENKFYVLAGCQNAKDPRKGFDYFVESLSILERKLSEVEIGKIVILIVSREIADGFSKIQFSKKTIDYIEDYRLLSLLYQAADVFVNASIEDSGPMMVSEALACGTPVVGFDMGVVSNLVISNYNGYKAINKNGNDLALGIEHIFKLSKSDFDNYSKHSVKQIETFSSFEYAKECLNELFVN